MSAATWMGRYEKPEALREHDRAATRLPRRSVAVRTFSDWDDPADRVHGGGLMAYSEPMWTA